MSRVREAPAGCIVYFMLSIVINLFILILRISALEVHNNSTLATTNYRTIPTASVRTTNDDTGATESGKKASQCYIIYNILFHAYEACCKHLLGYLPVHSMNLCLHRYRLSCTHTHHLFAYWLLYFHQKQNQKIRIMCVNWFSFKSDSMSVFDFTKYP